MSGLIPISEAIPVHWGFLKILLLLLFPLHLILMNAMIGAALIAAYASLKADKTMKKVAAELVGLIPLLVAFAVNLGVAALLFLQVLFGQFFYTSSILMGSYWIMVIPLIIISYYGTYLFKFKFAKGNMSTIFILFSLLIFLIIAFLLSNNMTLMLHPEKWPVYFDNRAGTFLNIADPTLLPRYLHFIIGGIAVGGLFVALLGRLRTKLDSKTRAAMEAIGMRVFMALTALQIVDGFWFLISLPKRVLTLFVGGNTVATVLLFIGLSLAILVLVAGTRRKVYYCACLMFPLIYVMTFLRDFVRSGYLQPYFSPHFLKLSPQYAPMYMFLLVLMIGVLTIAWMIRKVFVSCPAESMIVDQSQTITD